MAKVGLIKADVVVIGGEVSELVASIAAAEADASVIVFEKTDISGEPLNTTPIE